MKHAEEAKYPLHAGSYTSAVVDLNSPSWPQSLIHAGNNKAVPESRMHNLWTYSIMYTAPRWSTIMFIHMHSAQQC